MALSKLFLEGLKKIPGLTFYDVGAKAKDKISLVFRYTDPEGNRKFIGTKSFDPKTATEAEVQKEISPFLKEVEGKIQKRGGDVNAIRAQYTKAKLEFTDELNNWLEANASNPKYKSPEQLLKAAEKAFDKPMYTQVPAKVDKSKVFYNKQRGFLLPRQYEFYGKDITSKNPKKPLTDMALVALLKSDNPQFVGKKDLLMKFYNRDPKSPKPELTKEENKFLKNFSKNYIKGGAGGAGIKSGQETGSVIFRYLKSEGANFENKLNEWNEIRRLETDIKKELQLSGLTQNRINFLTKSLNAVKDKRINVAEKLRKEYPDLLTGKTGDVSGSLVQEHKIARAIGETSESFIPSTYLAKAEFTPAAFNLQKLKDFDTPLMSLIEKYNKAPQSQRPELIKQIKELKKDFNLKSGGYLDDVDIQFGTKTVKLKDKTPFIFETSPADTYSQILKNIKHSNTYFKNKGVNEKIISGDSFNAFQKDLKTRIANQKGANLKSTLMGLGIGIPATSTTLDALEDKPLQAAEPQQPASIPEDIEFGDPETWDKKVLDFVKEYPVVSGTAAGTTAIGGTLATKTGRKALGTLGKGLVSTPAGAALLNLGLGVDPTETLDRTFLEAELAAAPALVKGAQAMTKNPLLQRLLTLGIGPRVAAGLSGVGIAALAGEGLYELGKRGVAEYEKLQAMTPEEKEDYLRSEVDPLMDEGGMVNISREGFKDGSKPPKMDRRMFMKIMGGIMSLPVLGKVGKVAKPTVKALAKEAQAIKIPPYFFKMVDKIKNLGEDVSKRFSTQEREVVYNYRTPDADYELIEDLNTGDKRIKILKGDPDFPGYKEQELTLKKGQADEATGFVPDEYDEYTVRSDFDGKMKDIDEGIEDIGDLVEEVGVENVSLKDLQDAGYDVDRLPYELRKKLGIK